MDFSKFLDDNFDTKEWVNQAFASNKDSNTAKDQYATNLVVKLQMYIQEVNNIIEESSQQAIQNLPRVVRETEAIRQESELLQDQMRMVKEDIEKVERDTSSSMKTLLRLDGVKIRMKAASDALQEADNWTTLSSDVEDVFRSQDIEAITAKLVGMQQSLQMLVDVSDYEQRVQHLEKLKNRLEAMLSPQLVAAFNAQSLDAALLYVKIFTDIDRLPQLHGYYHKCQKARLHQSWRDIIENNPEDTLAEWLTEFYDLLISTWHAQMKWCGQAFQDPVVLVSTVLTETLVSLEPSIQSLIVNSVRDSDQTLLTVIELKKISDRFAKSMESVLDNTYTSGNMDLACVRDLAKTIFLPYRRYITKYGAFEDKFLNKELDDIPLDHSEVIDSVQLLATSVGRLFSVADAANDRCVSFTCGTGYPDLLQALDSYFTSYLKEFQRVLVNLKEKCHGDPSDRTEDWSLFQHSMRIIQTCGELILHTEEFDQNVIASILDSIGGHAHPPIQTSPKHHKLKNNPFHDYKTLYLESEQDKRSVDALLEKLDEGETPSVLQTITSKMHLMSEAAHKFAFDIIFAQLKEHLRSLHTMEIWTSHSAGAAITTDLPQFSLSPQEYITKIGQYLMTLPQQLEPFTLEDNPAVLTAVKYGKLPFTEEREIPEHMADLWLESLARGTMHVYCEGILKIQELSPHALKQLVMDIEYLCNVVDDLGLHPSTSIADILTLLKSPESEFKLNSASKPQRMVSAISGMRTSCFERRMMHLGKDSTRPNINPSKKRLYSMRFCPFSERARLALSLKCIETERVNIKLRDEKPAWYLDLNPKGSVPCLVLEDGRMITDSSEIVEFAGKNSPCCGHNFTLETDIEKERHVAALNQQTKLHKALHALLFDAGVDVAQLMVPVKESMIFYEANISGPYYHGDSIKCTDIMVFPWLERLEPAFKMADLPFPSAEFPKLMAYIGAFSSVENVKSQMETTEIHYRFARSQKDGSPNYDIE